MNSYENSQFTRRQVLAGVIGTIGFAAAGGMPGNGMATEKSPMRIGCGTVCFRKRPFDEAVERIRRAGFEYIEPQATGPWCPHVDVWKDDPQKFRQTIQKAGFKGVSGLWSLHGAIIPNPKSVEGITQTIKWAGEAGIPVVQAGDGRKPDKMSEEDALKILRDRLGEILEVAEKCKVYLCIEPHGTFSLTADGLNKIMALSRSKWLGINYDTANVHRATYVESTAGGYSWTPFGQRQNEVATLKAVINRVVHVHVKDVIGTKCVVLGEGKVNVKDCLKVLKENGYSGVLSLETEGEFEADEGQRLIEASRQYLLKTLAEI